MSVTIIPKQEQTTKLHNEGAIEEQKMLGFPQDKGALKPYSNIFYWSHVKTDYGSIVKEYPHIGFEIIIYVLKGKVEILDNINGKRSKLKEGDMQVIKSGKGMKHFEKLNSNSEVIQIWLDPDFERQKKSEPSLSKSTSSTFPVNTSPGKSIRTFSGESAPIVLDSPGVNIQLLELSPMEHQLNLDQSMIMSGYILKGKIEIENKSIEKGDFFIIQDTSEIKLKAFTNTTIFTVVSPDKPSYPTYAEMYL
jgi:redox-sensitive bicupin YhaK (pirin superfamily)